MRICVSLVQRWAVSCFLYLQVQRLQIPLVSLFLNCFLTLNSSKSSSLERSCVLELLAVIQLLSWSPVGVLVRSGGWRVFYYLRVKSVFQWATCLACDLHKCFSPITPSLVETGRLEGVEVRTMPSPSGVKALVVYFPHSVCLCYGEGSERISQGLLSPPPARVERSFWDLHSKNLVEFLEPKPMTLWPPPPPRSFSLSTSSFASFRNSWTFPFNGSS